MGHLTRLLFCYFAIAGGAHLNELCWQVLSFMLKYSWLPISAKKTLYVVVTIGQNCMHLLKRLPWPQECMPLPFSMEQAHC